MRKSLRHLEALRHAGPQGSDSDVAFPEGWFDLTETLLADLGAMAWLTGFSRAHAALTLPQVMAQIEVPLRLQQYRIFRSGGYPRAFVTWAGLSDGAERRFALQHQPLRPQDWNGGTSTWVVDFIAPFGHLDEVLDQMQQARAAPRVRTLWHNKLGTRYRIIEWARAQPDSDITVRSFGVGQFARHLDGT
ncbi:toxin-activating lysine-acyltransferase [Rhodobacteraceae bacterium KMM 6894]|nr:toxin-activating lysine-acyltransferase [Rhodobacteraceae bacterium KMM 6894]